MKFLISILFLTVISVQTFSQDCKTGIIVISDAANVRIFINDTLEFKDQFEFELDKGDYRISVLDDSDRWDSKSYTDSFILDSCEIKEIIVSFSDEFLIDSSPQDAGVFISDSLIGYTPLLLSQSINKITLKKSGFTEQEIILDNRRSRIVASLDFVGEYEKEKFFNKTISKVLLGSMIALGAATAYYKIKADNNFDNFIRTGDPKYKKRTDEYDLISGVTLGLTQINFGFLIYKIFSDN